MSYVATTDPKFLRTLEAWLLNQKEILVMTRYSHAAGSREFEFFSSISDLSQRLRQLPRLAYVTAFKQQQLPLRGIVDDAFVTKCLENIPEGSEYLVVETVRRVYGRRSWFHDDSGVSHAELRDDLEESRGVPVAVGLYPPWLKDSDDVASAIVPDEQGVVRLGVY